MRALFYTVVPMVVGPALRVGAEDGLRAAGRCFGCVQTPERNDSLPQFRDGAVARGRDVARPGATAQDVCGAIVEVLSCTATASIPRCDCAAACRACGHLRRFPPEMGYRSPAGHLAARNVARLLFDSDASSRLAEPLTARVSVRVAPIGSSRA